MKSQHNRIKLVTRPGHNSDDFWNVLLKGRPVRKVLRSVLTMIIIAAVVKNNKSRLSEELEDLREFYDPDTVDLMDWINAGLLESPTQLYSSVDFSQSP